MSRLRTVAAVAAVSLGLAAAAPIGLASRAERGESGHERARTRKVKRLYADLVFPIPTLILAGRISVDNIFDPTVRGRVTPVGQFEHSEAVSEYFFALASTPMSRVTEVTFQSLLAQGDKVAVEVDVHFKGTGSGPSFTLRQTGFFTFNEADRIVSFDLTILNLGAAVNPKSDEEKEANIASVCGALTVGVANLPATCPGEYKDFDDCVAFKGVMRIDEILHLLPRTHILAAASKTAPNGDME